MYQILLSKSARRAFETADSPLQRKLDRCFDRLRSNPYRGPNVKRLRGELAGYYRYRVGQYRVVYRIDSQGNAIIVVIIAHRGQVYG